MRWLEHGESRPAQRREPVVIDTPRKTMLPLRDWTAAELEVRSGVLRDGQPYYSQNCQSWLIYRYRRPFVARWWFAFIDMPRWQRLNRLARRYEP